MRPIRWIAVSAFAATCLANPVQAQQKPPFASVPIEIEARDIPAFSRRDPTQRRFGELEFIGGAVFTSKTKEFGGISGLHIRPDNQSFIAHSDRGNWFRGKFTFDGDRITGIQNAEMTPMRGPKGRLSASSWFDTESLAVDGETLYVGIERENKILRYDRFGEIGIPIPVPQEINDLPYNQGLEALVFVPRGMPNSGSLIAISERGIEIDGNTKGFIRTGGTWSKFSVKHIGQFQVSDAAISPTGHLLILERYFTFLSGIHLRIRAVPLDEIKPNAVIEGKILIEVDNNFEIDNMEALAITKSPSGQIVLTLMSDNNFSMFQRTILLRFLWPQQSPQ
jgi:hypothetical protein